MMLEICLHHDKIEAGCDEAGRGCLAGPVFAAAVILPHDCRIEGLDDSKKLSEKQREKLKHIIKEKAIAWAVASADETEIDKINILNASILSMHRALAQLSVKPEWIAVDGNRFKKYTDIPHTCIVKGDGKFMNIAAASVLAKTTRDEFMLQLHNEFPQYNWAKNKGYPSPDHIKAVKEFGNCKYHRKSFRLKAVFPEFEF